MKPHLSKPEKLMLFALAEDANRTDSEIAERVEMKESTVSLHRRNLIKNKQVFFVNFPDIQKLGGDFVVELFGYTNPALPFDEKNSIFQSFFSRNPQIYDAVAAEGFVMASGAFFDLSDLLLFEERYESFFESVPISKNMINYAFFPFDISHSFNSYNFGPCLHRIFNLDLPEPRSLTLKKHKKEEVTLSNIESKALIGIIDNPNATDSQLAQKIRRSRTRVNELKNEFIEQGLFKRTAVPTLISSEFGTIAYVHLKFKHGTPLEKKIAVAGDEWWQQACYLLERNIDLFAIYSFSNFKEYSKLINAYIGPFQDAGLIVEQPKIYVLSMENVIDIVDSRFGPLIRHLLF